MELFPNGCEGSTNLPAGWHYDPKTHEIYLGSTADFWSFEDGFLVRNHVWSRDCTFHTTDFPLPAEKLQTTNGLTMRRNSRIILVNEEQSAPVGDEPWLGKTLYPLAKDAAAEFWPKLRWRPVQEVQQQNHPKPWPYLVCPSFTQEEERQGFS